jgi:anti-sigma28 factor (negative regulator of flagellin synthesis)
MRVDELNLNDQVASTANRAADSQRVQVTTAGSAGLSVAAECDQVDLSSLTGRISRAMQTMANHASQRVSQLQRDYRAGRYQPDARQISRAMLSHSSGVAGS